jgi:putative PIN family toxin of toxin-antitoxin system
MIAVLDTDVLLSALITSHGYPWMILRASLDGGFDLATTEEQITELRNASRKPKLVELLRPDRVGLAINHMRRSMMFFNVAWHYNAADPTDAYLLDLAVTAKAHYLVTGDKKSGVLQLGKVGTTRILTPAEFFNSVMRHQSHRSLT